MDMYQKRKMRQKKKNENNNQKSFPKVGINWESPILVKPPSKSYKLRSLKKVFYIINGIKQNLLGGFNMNSKYYFKNDTKLTNYYMCNVQIEDLVFSSSEAAYHAEKFVDKDIKKLMTKLIPDESKHVSRELSRFIRDDWEEVKYRLMKKVVLEKFKQNRDCLMELLNTNNKELIEDTTGWHDNIWGECTCDECKDKEHKNLLGKILMEVREELKNKN